MTTVASSNVFLINNGVVTCSLIQFTSNSLDQLNRWIRVDPVNRKVYGLSSGLWYRLSGNGWGKGVKEEPKQITMSRMVEAITYKKWKELKNEVPPITL